MKKTYKDDIKKLKEELASISYLGGLNALSRWDQEVYMPEGASGARSKAIAELSGYLHNRIVSLDKDGLISRLRSQYEAGNIKGKDAVIVYEAIRSFDRSTKFPESFVKEYSELTSKAQVVWAEARKKNDASLFLPYLSKIVLMKQKEATYIGYLKSPYDALLDEYEPGMTAEEVETILYDLKDFLVPFIKKITSTKRKTKTKSFKGKFSLEKQIAFNNDIAGSLGFDFTYGRLDASTHPFTTNFHPTDVRITTRYKEDDVLYSLGSTIHEVGHALYEQGLPSHTFGTALSESISLGIHESQSRLWENQVGKSKEFSVFLQKKLAKHFPFTFKKVKADDLYMAMNQMNPSLIRTESDEVTYNLHIIIRFEIEKGLIEGSIEVEDVPKIWKDKMKEYLGINVPSDTLGFLQDVHWSCGLFGYFPTYSLGNLYSAQMFSVIEKEIPHIKKDIKKGSYGELREWLRKKVHVHGKVMTADKLIRKISGEPLLSRYFNEYIEKKYSDIYNLK